MAGAQDNVGLSTSLAKTQRESHSIGCRCVSGYLRWCRGRYNESVALLKDYISVMGLTPRQFAALLGAGYLLGERGACAGLFCDRRSLVPSSSRGNTTEEEPVLTNQFFLDLLGNSFQTVDVDSGGTMYIVSHF